jgi:hypothetical protein
MGASIQLTDKQQVAIGVTLLDADGQPFDALPKGVTVSFKVDNPDVALVAVRPDGMNADVGSGKVGTAVIMVAVDGVDPAIPPDSISVTVVNSKPGSLNLTIGEPSDEPEPAPAPQANKPAASKTGAPATTAAPATADKK